MRMVSVNFKLQLQPVVSQPDVRRQGSVGFLMAEIVRDMSKEGASGGKLLNQAQRVLYRRVRRMRTMAKSIEKQNVELAEVRHRVWRNLAEVGEIGGASKAVSINLSLAVQQLHRKKV